jgi:hypothetical protein
MLDTITSADVAVIADQVDLRPFEIDDGVYSLSLLQKQHACVGRIFNHIPHGMAVVPAILVHVAPSSWRLYTPNWSGYILRRFVAPPHDDVTIRRCLTQVVHIESVASHVVSLATYFQKKDDPSFQIPCYQPNCRKLVGENEEVLWSDVPASFDESHYVASHLIPLESTTVINYLTNNKFI